MSSAIKYHVGDNYQGTFLTMWSTGGIVFGIINIVSSLTQPETSETDIYSDNNSVSMPNL
jgi:hypothetical protein